MSDEKITPEEQIEESVRNIKKLYGGLDQEKPEDVVIDCQGSIELPPIGSANNA